MSPTFTKTTWMHYIGGYYSSPEKFIAEALREQKSGHPGVTRRVPPNIAGAMNYGDRVILLRYGGKEKVFAFAELVITTITLEHEIAQAVGEQLRAEGRAHYSAGGLTVSRECGSFGISGTWVVEAEIGEIIERAKAIAAERGLKLSIMVGGDLVSVYPKPILLSPAPKFSRGFLRAKGSETFTAPADVTEKMVVAINGYRQREKRPAKKERQDFALPLLEAPAT